MTKLFTRKRLRKGIIAVVALSGALYFVPFLAIFFLRRDFSMYYETSERTEIYSRDTSWVTASRPGFSRLSIC